MSNVVPISSKKRQTMTAKTVVFHALRVYGPAGLSDLTERIAAIAENANFAKAGPLTPTLDIVQVGRALDWLNQNHFVRFDRGTRKWKATDGGTIPSRWRDTFEKS